MVINILAFGIVKEIFGSSVASIEVSDAITAQEIINSLKEIYPGINKLTSFAIAVNGTYAVPDMTIKQSDEIAIIPPVSGG